MTTRKSVNSLAKIVLLTAFCLAVSPITANSQVCGDVNEDGSLDLLDQAYIIDYLFRGGPPPPDFSVAEIDGYEKLTMRDYAYLDNHFCQGGIPPICTSLLPPIQPAPDSLFLLSHTQWIDSGVTNTIITIELFNPIQLEAFSLAFKLKIGNDTPQIDSIESICASCHWFVVSISGSAAKVSVPNVCSQIDSTIVTINAYVEISPSSQRRQVSMTLTQQFSPEQAPTPDSSLITMLIDRDLNAWQPVIICCFQDRGDLNGDGDYGTILDLTHLVDYIFRGSGDAGSCPDEADVNNDGDPATVLDLTTLIDYIFRGGELTSCYE